MTVPAAAARIGVPLGTAMSIPSWNSAPPKREPKPETTGPSTGQIRPLPLPPRIGPAGSGAEPVPASRAASFAWIEATSPSSSCFPFADLRQRRLALAPRRHQGRLAPLHGRAGVGERLLFGGDRVARRFDPVLCGAQAGDGALHLIAQFAHPPDHRFVEPVDPAQVLGAVDQLFVATRFDQHVEDVGRARLVDRDQVLAQGDRGRVRVERARPPGASCRRRARPAPRRAGAA